MIEYLQGLPLDIPPIYIDLDGVDLRRYGIISILQMYIHPLERVYLGGNYTLSKSLANAEK